MGGDERDRWFGVVAELSLMPDVVERLLAVHVDDGHGFCRSCRTPGRGTSGTPHPCSLATLAAEARRNTLAPWPTARPPDRVGLPPAQLRVLRRRRRGVRRRA